MDDYRNFIDNLHFVHSDELPIGPKVEDLVSFFFSSPELSEREYTSNVFKLCCLCCGYLVRKLLALSLGSSDKSAVDVDLSDVIEPLQSYLLDSGSEQNIITSLESISLFLELLDDCSKKALQPGYDT